MNSPGKGRLSHENNSGLWIRSKAILLYDLYDLYDRKTEMVEEVPFHRLTASAAL